MSSRDSVSNLSGTSSGFPGPVSPVSGQEEKQCRYPAANNNLGPDPVMNYAASLATASSPGTNIAAAAHFYQQQVSQHHIVQSDESGVQAAAAAMDPGGHHLPGGGGGLAESRYPWMSITGELEETKLLRITPDGLQLNYIPSRLIYGSLVSRFSAGILAIVPGSAS